MTMTFDMWHDGESYGLDLLSDLSPDEIAEVESALLSHTPRDWRDIEALGHLKTPRALQEIERALSDPDPQVRRVAQQQLPEKIDPVQREKLLIASIAKAVPYEGLTQVLLEAEEFHPPSVVHALLQATLRGPGESAVHYAALLYYLHGKAKEPFDWDHRPFFLKFNTSTSEERMISFRELCSALGMDPSLFMTKPLPPRFTSR